jgi:hypothetical protein
MIMIDYRNKIDRKAKKQLKKNTIQSDMFSDDILKFISESSDIGEQMKAMLAVKKSSLNKTWRGLIAVPPASLLDNILGEFQQNTNIPLEIPFFVFFHILSGYLLNKNIYLDVEGKKILPDIWTIILASSGAGKTYTRKSITDAFNISDIEFEGTGIASSAAFIDALKKKPKGFWLRDEFAQFLKRLENEGALEEMKDYLLRIYDNDEICRETKKYTVTINEPALTILGLTVLETFGDYVSAESMLDGFAQRFSYVISEPDPERHFLDYPIWKLNTGSWMNSWKQVTENLHNHYRSSEKSLNAFKSSFRLLYKGNMPESFYRRITWKAHKYALIYHIIRRDKSQTLTLEDYGWAARALKIHIDDAIKVLGENNMSKLEKVISSAERLVKRKKEEGKVVTTRDLISGVRNIKTANEATAILKMIS